MDDSIDASSSRVIRGVTIALAAAVHAIASADARSADCACPEAGVHGGWCTPCKVGYVAAVKIESADLFEALDAHGHHVDTQRIQCPTCREAVKSNGFCDACGMGFVNKLAYLSKLTYYLALGTAIPEREVVCPSCKPLAGHSGWCAECGRGWIGWAALDRKPDYEQAAQAYAILIASVKMLAKCETCAVAMVTDARCPTCQIAYRNGHPVPRPASVGPAEGTAEGVTPTPTPSRP